MSKFKVGDKVRILAADNGAPKETIGRTGVVTGANKCLDVKFDQKFKGHEVWSYTPEELAFSGEGTFKKGDRVRLIDDTNCSAKVGAEATVERVSSHFVYVKWIDGSKVNGQMDGGYDFKQFEVVPKGTFTCLTVEGLPQGGYVVHAMTCDETGELEALIDLAAFTSLPEATAFIERNMA